MTSRWKSKSRGSSVILQEQQQKIQELELLLAQRDEKVAELEQRLAEKQQSVQKLRRERDELRNKNAALVGKLAEVSRKQSVASSNGTPPFPR